MRALHLAPKPGHPGEHGKQIMKIGGRCARSALAVATVAAPLASAPLSAGTAGGTMTVSATVEESCHLDARPMVFGEIANERGSVEAHSSVVLSCTPATSYSVTIDDGRNGANGVRRMADASGMNFLAYELYSDPTRSRRWGTSEASAVSAVAPVSGHVELPVYARLEVGRSAAGRYDDVVTVTVTF